MGFIDEIKARAKVCKKTIVLPETEDERTYKAAEAVLKEGIADLVLVGSKEEIEKNKGTYDISGAARLKSVLLAVTREPISMKLFSSTNLVMRCIARLSLLLFILFALHL